MHYQSSAVPIAPSILEQLAQGRPVLSLGVRYARTGDVARMASGAGYQVIWVDLEHSTMPIDCAAAISATAHDLGMAAWVRVPEREYGVIGRLLDGGATGIVVPKIETADEARLIAAACRFPPQGQRSSIALLPQSGFVRMPAAELMRKSDDRLILQMILESAKGIANVDEIAAVEGVDLLGVGTNDLSADLGCPGDLRNPRVMAACAEVAAAAKRHGKIAVCGGIVDQAHFQEVLNMGFAPLIFAGIDTDVLAGALAQRVADARERFCK